MWRRTTCGRLLVALEMHCLLDFFFVWTNNIMADLLHCISVQLVQLPMNCHWTIRQAAIYGVALTEFTIYSGILDT
jgi:hypothetical protein